MAITRTPMIDDDGSGTTGTILNHAWKQELYNQIDGAFGAWQSYTPLWTVLSGGTVPTLGNGTIVGRYVVSSGACLFHIDLMFGSTTAYGAGFYTLSLPVPAATNYNLAFSIWASLGGSIVYQFAPQLVSATEFYCLIPGTAGIWGPAAPVVIVSGNHVHVTGSYEIA